MKGGGRGIGGTAKSLAHKARVPTRTHWLDARDACFDVAKEIGERRTVAGEKLRYPPAFLRAPSSLHVQCQSSLHCLSYHNGGTKPQPGDRTPLQSPSALCCFSSWRQRRRYRFPFLRVHQLTVLPHGSGLLLFPLLHWVRKQQNYPRAWHCRVARIPPFSIFLSSLFPSLSLPPSSLFSSLFLSFSLTTLFPAIPFPDTPPLPPLFAVEAAAFWNASTSRGTKGKGWRCKMSPLCRRERAYTSMFFELRC